MSESGKETIYYLDHITAVPGKAKALLDFYMKSYVPKAEARGMTLLHRLVAPPVWLENQSNDLFIIWTVQGPQAWWQATRMRRSDPELVGFWAAAETLIVSRRRSYLSDAMDVERLCNV